MSTKPILFSTPMVQAILVGRKTMTRRVIKPQPTYWDDGECVYGKDNIVGPEFYNPICVDKDGEQYPGEEVYGIYSDNGEYGCESPYKPGDVLWVRETWSPVQVLPKRYLYKADAENGGEGDGLPIRWRPSIHMPRAAARIFLRVTDVRVERVQDILCGDMQREGCIPKTVTGGQWQQWQHDYWIPLWDSISAERGYGWDKNPWVWVYSFERVDKPAGWPGVEVE